MNYFNYFTEIEETFIRRRGKHLLLSPLDWALIESWQEREIPLRIILRGIENVFDMIDKNPNRKTTVKSLSYCRSEIELQYAEWLETQVGKNGEITQDSSHKKIQAEQQQEQQQQQQQQKQEIATTTESSLFSKATIQSHLKDVGNSLDTAKAKAEGASRQILEEVTKKISEYKNTEIDAESLEECLNDLEEMIDKSLLESINKETLAHLNKEIEKELSQHKLKMEKDVYERTFNLLLLKKLREQAEIPRLSLFYL